METTQHSSPEPPLDLKVFGQAPQLPPPPFNLSKELPLTPIQVDKSIEADPKTGVRHPVITTDLRESTTIHAPAILTVPEMIEVTQAIVDITPQTPFTISNPETLSLTEIEATALQAYSVALQMLRIQQKATDNPKQKTTLLPNQFDKRHTETARKLYERARQLYQFLGKNIPPTPEQSLQLTNHQNPQWLEKTLAESPKTLELYKRLRQHFAHYPASQIDPSVDPTTADAITRMWPQLEPVVAKTANTINRITKSEKERYERAQLIYGIETLYHQPISPWIDKLMSADLTDPDTLEQISQMVETNMDRQLPLLIWRLLGPKAYEKYHQEPDIADGDLPNEEGPIRLTELKKPDTYFLALRYQQELEKLQLTPTHAPTLQAWLEHPNFLSPSIKDRLTRYYSRKHRNRPFSWTKQADITGLEQVNQYYSQQVAQARNPTRRQQILQEQARFQQAVLTIAIDAINFVYDESPLSLSQHTPNRPSITYTNKTILILRMATTLDIPVDNIRLSTSNQTTSAIIALASGRHIILDSNESWVNHNQYHPHQHPSQIVETGPNTFTDMQGNVYQASPI
ncbi:hypothetical protein DRH14_02700 [Candidatus Shapirobacteria bacterium]|nr:MAG: hypothetical protein DRH14_02700 [Candidatus Shapirobacteria bacterium]